MRVLKAHRSLKEERCTEGRLLICPTGNFKTVCGYAFVTVIHIVSESSNTVERIR